MENPRISILPAVREDVPQILSLIVKIAEYEKLAHMVTATEQTLAHALFVERSVECRLIYEDQKQIGYLLFFHNFSSFLGRKGLYIEDIFLLPEYRKKGYGKIAFDYLKNLAVTRGCGRVEWSCLDWNEPSKRFYASMGAAPMDEWTTWRLVL